MILDFSKLDTKDLKTLEINYCKAIAEKKQVYLMNPDKVRAGYEEIRRELAGRSSGELSIDRSTAKILDSAKAGRFISYGELAEASGASWIKVRRQMPSHLWLVISKGHERNAPMLSAIVVNKPNLKTGDMEPETLKGFITAARDLGYSVTNEVAFLKDQQRRVFEWAQSASV